MGEPVPTPFRGSVISADRGEAALVEIAAQGANRDVVLVIIQALLGVHGFEASHPVDLDSHRLEIVLPAGWRDLPIVQALLPGLARPVASFLKGDAA